MTMILDGSSGATFPAGGVGNPTSTVVGISDTQTLTNKTLTSPTLTSPTLTSPTISGTPVVSGSLIPLATSQASTSGTSIDFTSIPSWVKRITVMFNGVSTNGTSNLIIQIGTSGTPKTSGYLGSADTWSTGVSATLITNGFGLTRSIQATSILNGNAIISTSGSNAWSSLGMLGSSESAFMHVGAGSVSLSGTLDMVRITTVAGTNTFDAGSINIQYE